ncbi:hypothetical protein BBJ28_00014580 [Nothophytophthora sp. Chile5]|nr:hypothetical protein BBJ28_00014580 [Nothophytophthora sp. Chile5]
MAICRFALPQPVNITPRRVSISQIQLQELTGGDFPEATVRVVCGAGTYIRSIARECGEALLVPRELQDSTRELRNPAGELCVGGTLTELERSRSGAFEASASLDFDEIRDKLDVRCLARLGVWSAAFSDAFSVPCAQQKGESPLQTVDSVLQHLPFAVLPPMKAQHWLSCGIVSVAAEDVLIAAEGQTAPKQHAALVHGESIRVFCASSPELLGISKVEQQDESPQRFVLRKRIFV